MFLNDGFRYINSAVQAFTIGCQDTLRPVVGSGKYEINEKSQITYCDQLHNLYFCRVTNICLHSGSPDRGVAICFKFPIFAE